jgi:putative hydrolase of the HAD superfamily
VTITHVFFDVGGVLGSNGWDHEQRAGAVKHFELDPAEMEDRHGESIAMLEQGRMTLDDYLRCAVFYRPRPFTVETFKAYMLAQSVPYVPTIDFARELAASGRYRMMTINNEPDELNWHRIRYFGLRDIFVAFFTSCWLGVMKPARRIYELALAMSQAEPSRSVFIDDRPRNLEPARELGIQTIRYTDPAGLRHELAELGVQP